MADTNLLALQVQPPAPIGQTLQAIYGIRQTQAQTALTTAEGQQRAGLVAALQSGNPNKVAQYDPTMASAMLGYNNQRDAYGVLRSPTGQAALKGDPDALDTLSRLDPTVGNAIRSGLSTAASTSKEQAAAESAHLGVVSQYATQALTLPPGPDQDRFVMGLPDAILSPQMKQQYAAASPEQKHNMIVAAYAGATVAQNAAADTLYKPTTLDPSKPQILPGPLVNTLGVNGAVAPGSGSGTPAAGTAAPAPAPGQPAPPVNALAAAATPPPAAVPPATDPSKPGNALGADTQVPQNALTPPPPPAAVPSPAVPGTDVPPAIQSQLDVRAAQYKAAGMPDAMIADQVAKYKSDLLAGAANGQGAPASTPPVTPTPAPVPLAAAKPAAANALDTRPAPVPAAAVPPVAPVAAVAPPVVPTPATPVPPKAASGAAPLPPNISGLPVSAGGGGSIVTGGGPGYVAAEQAKADDLSTAGSVATQTKQQDLASQAGALLQILKAPNFWSGAGEQDLLKLQAAQQTIYSLLGVNDPALNEKITDAQSFAKFATLAAAAIAKQDVGARVTNFDLATFMNNQPGLGVSLQGNQRLLGVVDQVNQRNVQISKLAQDSLRDGSGWNGWTTKVQSYQDAHPIVDPQSGAVLSTASDGSVKRGAPVSVSRDELASGALDDRFHLLPGAQVTVDGQTYVYAGSATGKPGVTGAAAGAR